VGWASLVVGLGVASVGRQDMHPGLKRRRRRRRIERMLGYERVHASLARDRRTPARIVSVGGGREREREGVRQFPSIGTLDLQHVG